MKMASNPQRERFMLHSMRSQRKQIARLPGPRRSPWLIVVALALAASWGCTNPRTATTPWPCTEDTDCARGHVCVANVCQPPTTEQDGIDVSPSPDVPEVSEEDTTNIHDMALESADSEDFVGQPDEGEPDIAELTETNETREIDVSPDVPEPLCQEGSTQAGTTPCGLNDSGTLEQVCVAGQWFDIPRCSDIDVCVNGTIRDGTTACGLNGRGVVEQDCSAGQWVDSEPRRCNDPDECTDDAMRDSNLACGPNLRGLIQQQCLQGHWGFPEASRCLPEEECQDGWFQPGTVACGPDGELYAQMCVAGFWLDMQECRCVEDTSIASNVSCGLNGNGFQVKTCVAGQWRLTSICLDLDSCQNGQIEIGTEPCGWNEHGRWVTQQCEEGQWQDVRFCWDGDECHDGDRQEGPTPCPPTGQDICAQDCHAEAVGVFMQECVDGLWTDTDQCVAQAGSLFPLDDINRAPADGSMTFLATLGDQMIYCVNLPCSIELWKTNGMPSGTTKITELERRSPAMSCGRFLGMLDGSLLFLLGWDGGEPETGQVAFWKTDGSAAGTHLVKTVSFVDECRYGCDDGIWPETSFVHNGLVYVRLFIPGPDWGSLWRSDGTEEGTFVFESSIYQGGNNPVAMGNWVYFSGWDEAHGDELWRTDGTAVGTQIWADIRQGSSGSGAAPLTVLADTLFIAADDGEHGRTLWTTDGTANPIILLNETMRYGGAGPVVADTLYFSGWDAENGYELWRSDGTPEGTALVADSLTGTCGSNPSPLVAKDGVVYFNGNTNCSGNRELWRSDGTEEGTHRVQENCTGACGQNLNFLTVAGNLLFFSASNPTVGTELWRSDGTEGGTLPIDIRPGSAGSGPQNLTPVGTRVYFWADDGSNGWELWTSDGTLPGTVRVRDIWPEAGSSDPRSLTPFGNRLLFTARDPDVGRNPWITDATLAGTRRLNDFSIGTAGSGWGSALVVDENIYFMAAGDNPAVTALWRAQLPAAGAERVSSRAIPGSWTPLGRLDNTVFFYASQTGVNEGQELWRSDGTEADTYRVKDIYAGPNSSSITSFVEMRGDLYFIANDGTHGLELWRSDGTELGTRLVKDVRTGSAGGAAYTAYTPLFVNEGWLYFRGNDGNSGDELWRSDGTETGTQLFADIWAGINGSGPSGFSADGLVLFFTASDGIHGTELWRSEGTSATTVMVKDIHPESLGSGPSDLVVFGHRLYFVADGGNGRQIWKSDGTETATTQLTNITQSDPDVEVSYLRSTDTGLFFTATSPQDTKGRELWVSDGTAAGTHVIKEIRPNGRGSDPDELVSDGAYLFFTANDGEHGSELWVSDGSASGTFMVGDLYAGAAGSNPRNLTATADGGLFFRANDGCLGLEPWYYRPLNL